MNKRNADTAYAASGISNSKWLLLLCAASAAVVDIIIIAMLIAGGEAGEYLACPCLLLIFDAVYLAVSLFFTNFRFKYSIAVWASYIVLYTVGFTIGLAIVLGGEGTVITDTALALWASVHAFTIVCAVVCALFASRVIGKMWFALAVAAVFIVGAVVYAGFTFADGFFGQGTGRRTLVYSYNGTTGQYSVTGVLTGKSDTVRVPETFNGKPVTAVSLKVFAEKGINEYNLPDGIDFTDENVLLRNMNLSGKRINVDKKSVNDFREKFLEYAGGSSRGNALALANATLPVNLAANEGYVAFNYGADEFGTVNGNTIPVYVGDLENFDIGAYTAEYDYVTYRDNGSADNYYRAYGNGGYILSDIAGEGGSVFDGVTQSTVADVKFEKVYRIKVEDGNDNMYCLRDKQPELCFDNVGGSSEYKYLTMSKAGTLLDGLTPRAGFTYKWLCGGKAFTDLTEVLADDITISTQWELNKPTVSISTSAADNTLTYGEDVTLSSEVKHEAEGIAIDYAWYFGNQTQAKWSSQNVSFSHPRPSERSGNYKLKVTVGGNDITSLYAAAEADVDLIINPKQVTFDWHLPENTVYDGTDKSVSVSLEDGQEVEGHPLDYTCIGSSTFKNAGTYDFNIVTDVTTDKDYQVLNPTKSVTITARPVEVVWSDYENLEYNGSVQKPTATVTGVPADGELSVTVSGGNKNAGPHTATAVITDKNYTLTGATRTYTIAKKPLTITSKGVIVAYGKTEPQQVTVVADQCEGFVEGDGVASLSGTAMESYEGKDVGEYEGGVKIYGLTSNNYEITYVNGKLTIGKRIVQLEWSGADNLVYDGTPKNVTAVVTDKGYEGDDIRLIITGGDATDAGEHVATAEIDPNCGDADNYSMTTVIINGTAYDVEKQKPYTIQQAAVKITAQNKSSQYGEEFAELTARIDGTVYNDELTYSLSKQSGDNAGSYPITVTVAAGGRNGNYNVQTVEGTYTITKRVAYITWITESQRTWYYNGEEQAVFYDSENAYRGFLEKDLPYVEVTGHKATEVGEYVARLRITDSTIAGNYNLADEQIEWRIKKPNINIFVHLNYEKDKFDDEFEAKRGDTLYWVTESMMIGGSGVYFDNYAMVTYGDQLSSEKITNGRYVFENLGEYTIEIVCDDKNCEAKTRTLKITVVGIEGGEDA